MGLTQEYFCISRCRLLTSVIQIFFTEQTFTKLLCVKVFLLSVKALFVFLFVGKCHSQNNENYVSLWTWKSCWSTKTFKKNIYQCFYYGCKQSGTVEEKMRNVLMWSSMPFVLLWGTPWSFWQHYWAMFLWVGPCFVLCARTCTRTCIQVTRYAFLPMDPHHSTELQVVVTAKWHNTAPTK